MSDLPHEVEKRELFRWLPALVEVLEDKPDVFLFIHSSWRLVYDERRIREVLNPISPWLAGVTPPDIKGRLDSINHCIQKFDISDYVILDDNNVEIPPDHPNLILCHPATGLSAPDVKVKLSSWASNRQTYVPKPTR